MKIRVWGLAKGTRTTGGAARGAFCWREYENHAAVEAARKDWLEIVQIEEDVKPH